MCFLRSEVYATKEGLFDHVVREYSADHFIRGCWSLGLTVGARNPLGIASSRAIYASVPVIFLFAFWLRCRSFLMHT